MDSYFIENGSEREDPSGRCVSDGPIEFSSPVYHVYKARSTCDMRNPRRFK